METEKSLSVSELNYKIRILLEDLNEISVTGEISNLSRPSSGHLYFSLKDDKAQIRCAFFRNAHSREALQLKDGQQVIAKGRLSLYEARGDYQLIVQQLISAGIGDLYQQFEALKKKLAGLGLFSAEIKRPIPRYPKTIALITSPTGAAIRDILSTLQRRYPHAAVRVYPAEVQGKNSAGQLIRAIQYANEDSAKADVIILARGGGSIEDLWPFNNEQLAYAIRASKIPIVSGVGHETDFTIADFVADYRAATPTAAAEAVTPDSQELIAYLMDVHQRLHYLIDRYLQHKQLLLSHRKKTLSDPMRLILNAYQKLDFLDKQLQVRLGQCLRAKQHRYTLTAQRLTNLNPILTIAHTLNKLKNQAMRLNQALAKILTRNHNSYLQRLIKLDMVSPSATLKRGYAIVMQNTDVIRSIDQVKIGDPLQIRLQRGQLACQVVDKYNNEETLFNDENPCLKKSTPVSI